MRGDKGLEERVRLLREEILKEAELERRRLWEEFERKKVEDWERSRSKAERETMRMIEEVEIKAEDMVSREIANAMFNARKIILEERDAVLRETMERAKEEIFKVVERKEEYRERMKKLLKECVDYLGEGFEVASNPRDVDLLEELSQEMGIKVNVRPDPSIMGGIKAWTGKKAVDNTLKGRWERKKREIQMEVLKELFE